MQRVAEVAGVSKSSVSLALRDDPRLALATRRRIQEVAARLGYRKNPVVASLMAQLRVSQSPRFHANVALVNCSQQRRIYEDPRYAELRRGLRERLDLSGYGVDDLWIMDRGMSGPRIRTILETRGVRGVVLLATVDTPPLFTDTPGVFDEFCVVLAGFDRSPVPIHRAAGNPFYASRRALEIVIEVGYRRPGLVVNNRMDRALQRGWSAGFLAGLQDAPVSDVNRPMPLFLDSANPESFRFWFESERPDVILTDHAQVMDWVRALGLQVPEDVGLMHLDLLPEMENWAGMRQNYALIGAAAAELVLSQLSHNEFGARSDAKLVLTESEFQPGPTIRY